MKTLTSVLAGIVLAGLATVADVQGFEKVKNGVVTSSGTTVINLGFRTQEIFFIRKTTDTSYVAILSTQAENSGDHRRELRSGVVISDTVGANTTKFSVYTEHLPFDFEYEARGQR
jgi:hypothetical protein